MKETFLRVERWTTGLSMVAACAMLVIAAGLGVFQIVTRFVLEQPAEWSEILIRLSLIWMVFLGIPTAFRQGAMVADVLYRWSPPRIRRVLDAVVSVAALALMLVVLWYGWDYAMRGRARGRWPGWSCRWCGPIWRCRSARCSACSASWATSSTRSGANWRRRSEPTARQEDAR